MTKSKTDGVRVNSRYLKPFRDSFAGRFAGVKRKNGGSTSRMVEVVIPVGKPGAYGGDRTLLEATDSKTVKHLAAVAWLAFGNVRHTAYPEAAQIRKLAGELTQRLMDEQDGTKVEAILLKDGKTIKHGGSTFKRA